MVFLWTHLKDVDVRCTSALIFIMDGGDTIVTPVGILLDIESDFGNWDAFAIAIRLVVGLRERITRLMEKHKEINSCKS